MVWCLRVLLHGFPMTVLLPVLMVCVVVLILLAPTLMMIRFGTGRLIVAVRVTAIEFLLSVVKRVLLWNPNATLRVLAQNPTDLLRLLADRMITCMLSLSTVALLRMPTLIGG